MQSLFLSTLVKVAAPTAAIFIMLLVARKRGLSLRSDIGFRQPVLAQAGGWFLLWLVLLVAEEFIGQFLGIAQPKPWASVPPLILVMRILAIGIAGPIAEELLFRGLLLALLRRTSLTLPLILVITALTWSAMHFQYEIPLLAIIFVDGMVLGLARIKTGSLWVPIAMHVTGNLFSIYQSLS